MIARRGATDWVLKVTGNPAHSSQIFRDDVGAGAIFEAARILDGFYRGMARTVPDVLPGVVVGGTTADYDAARNRGTAFGKDNVVAGIAVVEGDLRTVSPEQLASAKGACERSSRTACRTRKPGSSSTTDDPPMAPSDGNRRLLALYDQVSRDLDLGPVVATDPMQAGAADVAFAAGRVKMAIDGVGTLRNGRSHRPGNGGSRDSPLPDEAGGDPDLPSRATGSAHIAFPMTIPGRVRPSPMGSATARISEYPKAE